MKITKAAPAIYSPLSLFTNTYSYDISEQVQGEKASKTVIFFRYFFAFLIAYMCLVYPTHHYRFLSEDETSQIFRMSYLLAGNIDIVNTIIRNIFIYGYALFLSLAFYTKSWSWRAINLSLFLFFMYLNRHDHPMDILLAMRAAMAWFILLHTVSDVLNQNYKYLMFDRKHLCVYLEKENQNVSIWTTMFFSSLIIIIEVSIMIALFYSDGGVR